MKENIMPIIFYTTQFHNQWRNLDFVDALHTNFAGTKVQNSYFGLNIFQSGIISNTSETGGLLPLSIFTNNLHCASFMSSGVLNSVGGGYIRVGVDDGTTMSSGMAIGGILFRANPSGVANHGGRIVAYSDDNWSSTSFPTKINIDTCAIGSTTLTTKMTIGNDGNILVGGFANTSAGLSVRKIANQIADIQRWENSLGSGLVVISTSGTIDMFGGTNLRGFLNLLDPTGKNLGMRFGTGPSNTQPNVTFGNRNGTQQFILYSLTANSISFLHGTTGTTGHSWYNFGKVDNNIVIHLRMNSNANLVSAKSPHMTICGQINYQQSIGSPSKPHTGIYLNDLPSGIAASSVSTPCIGMVVNNIDAFRVTPSGVGVFTGLNIPLGQLHITGSGATQQPLLVLDMPPNNTDPMAKFIIFGNTDVVKTQIDATGNIGLGSGVTYRMYENMPNSVMGTGVLVNGTTTINTTAVTQNSRIFLTVNDTSVLNVGSLYVGARTPGTSFVVNSSNALDARIFTWMMMEPM